MDLHTTPTRTRVAALAAVLFLAGLAGCSQGDDSTASGGDATTTTAPAGDAPGAGAEQYVVVAADFSLTDLTVGAGEEFTLDNQGDTTHTLTADDGSFDSGRIDAGQQSGSLTAPSQPGDYTYHCEIHATMTGTLTVE